MPKSLNNKKSANFGNARQNPSSKKDANKNFKNLDSKKSFAKNTHNKNSKNNIISAKNAKDSKNIKNIQNIKSEKNHKKNIEIYTDDDDNFDDIFNIDDENLQNNESKNANPIAKVAIFGRPNVGKSSLFNRLNKENIAITSHISGSTRDINIRTLELNKFCISLIDTGGLELNTSIDISSAKELNINTKNKTNEAILKEVQLKKSISNNTYSILEECDLIIYMIDGLKPLDDIDIKIFRQLSKKKEILLVINKIDNDDIKINADIDFSAFGVEFLCICVKHNRFITQLLNAIENKIQKMLDNKNLLQKHTGKNQNEDKNVSEEIEYENINIGIIGRPNVGKSSLLNALTRKNRSLVSNLAGTTIDPVDEKITYKNYNFTFIDTAGIRQKGKIDGIEKYALLRTKNALKKCQIALIVLDSSTDFTELDERICNEAITNDLGIIVIFNKIDIAKKSFEEMMKEYKRKFKFLSFAPVISISSATLKRVDNIKDKIIDVFNNFSFRIPTAKLNDVMANITKNHPLPSDHGKIIKIYYATQVDSKPPLIILRMNSSKSLHFSYKRYIINCLRDEFNLLGTPIKIEAKNKNSNVDDIDNT